MVSQKSPDTKFIVKKGNVPHFNIRISLYDKTSRKEIGYIHLVPFADKEWMEVLNVEIDPAWQRQGLGTKLYLKAKQTAQEAGYKGLVSDPGGRTPDASKLWKSIPGAKRSGRGWWVLENESELGFEEKMKYGKPGESIMRATEVINEGAFLNNLKPTDNVDKLWSTLNTELSIFDESSKKNYNRYALAQYLAKRMAGSNPSKDDVFKALRKYFEMRHTSSGPFFELYPVQACAEKYGVDYDSIMSMRKGSKPECKTYTAMGSSFLEAMNTAGEILCEMVEAKDDKLNTIAKEISSQLISKYPSLKSIKNYKITIVKDDNLVTFKFPVPSTVGHAVLSIAGHKTMSGQDREDADNAAKLGFSLLKDKFNKLGFKIEDSELYFDKGSWQAFFVSDNFLKEDVVTVDGKKVLKFDKPFYHKMKVDEFSDMTERELNKLIHKAVPGTTVHFSLSDLFTDEQLSALQSSVAFKQFSQHMKTDILNAGMEESVQKSDNKKAFNIYLNGKLYGMVQTKDDANKIAKEIKAEGDGLDKIKIERASVDSDQKLPWFMSQKSRFESMDRFQMIGRLFKKKA